MLLFTAVAEADSVQQLPVENSALYFGNPSNAEHDKKDRTNYLIEKKQYALS
jgi:hypothetical protein